MSAPPSVRNVVCAAELFCVRVCLKFGIGIICKKLSNKQEFHEIGVVVVILRDSFTAILRGDVG